MRSYRGATIAVQGLHVINMLNKNTLGVKKCEANQKPLWLYKRPKTLISSKAKKLNILLRIFSLE